MIEYRTRECVDPELDFAAKIIMHSDFSDLRYLYLFGEYITENELGVAAFLNGLSRKKSIPAQELIQRATVWDL